MSDSEFKQIIDNASKNTKRDNAYNYYSDLKELFNSIHKRDKTIILSNEEIKKIDEGFLNNHINKKAYWKRLKKSPMSSDTFNKIKDSKDKTREFNSYKKDGTKNQNNKTTQLEKVLKAANKLHAREKNYTKISTEQEFEKWLSSEFKAKSSVNNYVRCLNGKMDTYKDFRLENNFYGNVFDTTNTQKISTFCKRLLKNGDLHSWNKSHSAMLLSAAIGRYKNFLKQSNSGDINTDSEKKPIKKNKIDAPLNQILYGPPGTGKTFNTVSKALKILGDDSQIKGIKELKKEYPKRVEFITFHQSFSYEDFVEGLKANNTKDGKLSYSIENGIFKDICENASSSNKPHILIIDEINRGDVSRIFGELITLIEQSKRDGEDEAVSITLPYSKKEFSVPSNLYIIGTMNTADRSLTMLDTALRRRFDFIEMMPDISLVDGNFDGINLGKMLGAINSKIEVLDDREHLIGHSFLMHIKDIDGLKNAFENKILPLLEEYFYDDWDKIRLILNDTENNNFYEKVQINNIFQNNEEPESPIFKRKEIAELSAEAFTQIYQ